jgi:hypothetical protein
MVAVTTCSIKSGLNLIGGTACSIDPEITVPITIPSSSMSEIKYSGFNTSDIG